MSVQYYIAWRNDQAIGFWQSDLDDVAEFLASHERDEVTLHDVADVSGKTLHELTEERRVARTSQ